MFALLLVLGNHCGGQSNATVSVRSRNGAPATPWLHGCEPAALGDFSSGFRGFVARPMGLAGQLPKSLCGGFSDLFIGVSQSLDKGRGCFLFFCLR